MATRVPPQDLGYVADFSGELVARRRRRGKKLVGSGDYFVLHGAE